MNTETWRKYQYARVDHQYLSQTTLLNPLPDQCPSTLSQLLNTRYRFGQQHQRWENRGRCESQTEGHDWWTARDFIFQLKYEKLKIISLDLFGGFSFNVCGSQCISVATNQFSKRMGRWPDGQRLHTWLPSFDRSLPLPLYSTCLWQGFSTSPTWIRYIMVPSNPSSSKMFQNPLVQVQNSLQPLLSNS